MFDLFNDKIKIIKQNEIKTPDGLGIGIIEEEIEVECYWQEVLTNEISILKDGRVVKGQCEAGDGIALVKGNGIDFEGFLRLNHYVLKDNKKYRITQASKRPRDFWHLMCKRLEG